MRHAIRISPLVVKAYGKNKYELDLFTDNSLNVLDKFKNQSEMTSNIYNQKWAKALIRSLFQYDAKHLLQNAAVPTYYISFV